MTDTTETIVTPDPHAIARAVLLEVADESDQVGDFVTSYDLEDHVTDFRFAVNIRGYEGWQWSVTLYHDEEIDSWTVNESSLISTEDALMPPKWIPWKDRLEPTDLAPTDSIGTDPDDERIEEGEVEESSLQDVNDAVETFRLTRRHVLTSLGRAQAAKRWYEGPRGPKALSTKTAEGNLCSTCGFFVPLAGELDRMFGVCANKWSPDDGRVVSLDHAAASIPKSNLPSQASCGCSPSLLSTICISTWWPTVRASRSRLPRTRPKAKPTRQASLPVMISKHRRLLTGTPSILSPLRRRQATGPRNPSLPVMSPLHRTYLIPLWMLMQLIPATIPSLMLTTRPPKRISSTTPLPMMMRMMRWTTKRITFVLQTM